MPACPRMTFKPDAIVDCVCLLCSPFVRLKEGRPHGARDLMAIQCAGLTRLPPLHLLRSAMAAQEQQGEANGSAPL